MRAGSPSGRRGKLGHTLAEVLVASVILTLVVGGAVSLYLAIQRMWKVVTVHMEADRLATMAVNRIVYGYGARRGLRTARYGTVALQNVSGGWNLTYVTGNSQTNRFEYRRDTESLVLQPGGVLIGQQVTNAVVILQPFTAEIRVQTRFREGRYEAGGEYRTVVRWRN